MNYKSNATTFPYASRPTPGTGRPKSPIPYGCPHVAAGRIQHVDPFTSPGVFPVQAVQSHLVRVPIGDVHIDVEARR